MKSSLLVSVIITNYNYARFLNQAIESVFNQSYSHFELIVVDDGSDDNSREIIQSYGDRLISVFQPNGGMSASRNNGFARSSGEIICFLDADDYFHPDKLKKVVQAFQEHPDWVLVGHCWTNVDVDGRPKSKNLSNKLSQGDVRSLLLKWGKYASSITSASAYRRSALEKVMPVKGNYGIDSFLNSTLPFYGEVGCINESLMFYRIHGKNVRAHSDNISRLIRQREAISNFINTAADQCNITERFDLQHDPDYLSYKAIENGSGTFSDALYITWLSIRESIDIKRSIRDSSIRSITRLISTFPDQGKLVLKHGLRGYVSLKIPRLSKNMPEEV